MKRTLISLFVILSCLSLTAQEDMFLLGLRGGVGSSWLQSSQSLKSSFRPADNLDLRYVYYGPAMRRTQVGVMTGLSVGYAQQQWQGSFLHQFTNTDYLGMDIPYTTSGDIRMHQQQLYAEIPLMFSLRANGFILRVGPKAQLALWNQWKQSLSNPIVDAYYVLPDVHVVNELITGKVTDKQLQQTYSSTSPSLQILAGLEIGYEWRVNTCHHVGLVAYADYGIWNTNKKQSEPLIQVGNIASYEQPVPSVTVHNGAECLIERAHPFQVGVSVYYAFSGERKKHKQHSQVVYRTDTILQRDTIVRTEHDTLRLYQERTDTVYLRDTIYLKDTVIYVDTALVRNHPMTTVEKKMLATVTKANLSEIYYPSGSADVTKNEYLMQSIREMVILLRKDPKLRIRIIGHTDNTGAAVTNVVVGQRRADAVKIELLKRGANAQQVETTSMGDTAPIFPNDTPANRQKNRRVEIQLL